MSASINRGPAHAGPYRTLGVVAAVAIATAVTSLSAQTLLPSTPKKGFGASLTPAYDGWYENADGTKTFLVGYYNRNYNEELDIPIGANNRFEPGDPDRGQPTHFMTNRSFGMFTITVPKTFAPTERLWWTITHNGVTQRVGLILSPDYNITPQRASEESPGGKYNLPPLLRLTERGPSVRGPVATLATAEQRYARVGEPMPLERWIGFSLVWIALIVLTVDSIRHARRGVSDVGAVT